MSEEEPLFYPGDIVAIKSSDPNVESVTLYATGPNDRSPRDNGFLWREQVACVLAVGHNNICGSMYMLIVDDGRLGWVFTSYIGLVQ